VSTPRRRADGKEVLFGVNYAAIKALREGGAVPDSVADALEAGAIPKPNLPELRSSHTI
jgi:hypothetical protein